MVPRSYVQSPGTMSDNPFHKLKSPCLKSPLGLFVPITPLGKVPEPTSLVAGNSILIPSLAYLWPVYTHLFWCQNGVVSLNSVTPSMSSSLLLGVCMTLLWVLSSFFWLSKLSMLLLPSNHRSIYCLYLLYSAWITPTYLSWIWIDRTVLSVSSRWAFALYSNFNFTSPGDTLILYLLLNRAGCSQSSRDRYNVSLWYS